MPLRKVLAVRDDFWNLRKLFQKDLRGDEKRSAGGRRRPTNKYAVILGLRDLGTSVLMKGIDEQSRFCSFKYSLNIFRRENVSSCLLELVVLNEEVNKDCLAPSLNSSSFLNSPVRTGRVWRGCNEGPKSLNER